MALTLTEGSKYSTTELDRIVIDLLTKESTILDRLPFENLEGNSLTYDMITTDAGADFYNTLENWVESTASLTQDTVTLKILGGNVDLDEFILRTRSNKIDIKTTILENKAKAIRNKFLDTFYYGKASTTPKEFNGLQTFITSTTYNTVHAGSSTGTALSMNKVREAIDLITDYQPAGIWMSKALRRGISVYLDSVGDKFTATRDAFGNVVESFWGLPIYTDDHIVDVETASSGAYAAKTGGANTSLFILSFAPQACCGVQASNGLETVDVGQLESKDSSRYRIKWYCGLKFENLRSCAKVDGIVSAGTVTA